MAKLGRYVCTVGLGLMCASAPADGASQSLPAARCPGLNNFFIPFTITSGLHSISPVIIQLDTIPRVC